jgi:hypothetical protein
MNHADDFLNPQPAPGTEARSGLTTWFELTQGPWALVDCGSYGVRPRRLVGRLATGFQKRVERF